MAMYLIRQYAIGGQSLGQIRGLWAAPHTITTAMLLKADGTYEVYWYPSKQLRSRGTYTYSPETTRFRWLSGLNYEMGRGGTYIAEEGPCRPCIQMNGSTVAVPQ